MKTEKAVAAFLDAKQGLSTRTLEQYQKALGYLELECEKLPGKPDLLRGLLNKVSSVWVRHSYWIAWRVFFRWCKAEFRSPDPMDRVEKPKLPEVEMRTLELDELARVWESAESIRDKCVIALALDSGIRASEFGKLRIGDVGSDTVKVWGKGNKQVSVPISPETRQLLQVLIDQDGSRGVDAPLFIGESGKPLTRYGVYLLVRRCMERAGISGSKRGAHCLRHSLGRHHIASGGDAFTLQRIMRHTKVSTTQKYVNLVMDDVVRAHQEHSPLRKVVSDLKFEELLVEPIAEEEVRQQGAEVGGMAARLERLRVAHNHCVRLSNEAILLLQDQIEDLALLFESHSHRVDGSILLPGPVVEFLADEVARLKKEVAG